MRFIWGVALAGLVAACSPNLQVSDLGFGHATGVYTSGNLRMVTERQRFQPQLVAPQPVFLPTICTEPSPDYAVAFSQSAKATVDVEGRGGGTIAGASNEAALKLAGRNAGVLALRDGIYAACQSYSNGVIGHNAYALVLSQYGRELVELMAPAKSTGTAADPTAIKQRADSHALSALFVACISEYDQTRIGGEEAGAKNPLLDPGTCSRVMDKAALLATRSP